MMDAVGRKMIRMSTADQPDLMEQMAAMRLADTATQQSVHLMECPCLSAKRITAFKIPTAAHSR